MSNETPLTAEELDDIRQAHRSAITHQKQRCQTCRLLATLDAASQPDARRLAEALRAVDIIEKRPVDAYVSLAMEIAVAYSRARAALAESQP